MLEKVSTEEGRNRILDNIYEKLYAAKTWTSQLCEVKLYTNMCTTTSMVPFPITFLSVALFIGALVDEGYAATTIPVYVSTIFRQQILNWQAVPVELCEWKSMLVRGSKRDSEEAHRMLPITIIMIGQIQQLPNFAVGERQIFLVRMLVLSFFLLLRSDESIGSEKYRGLTRDSFEFSVLEKRITIVLGVTKTKIEGYICKRSLTCCCGEQPKHDRSCIDSLLPICPCCSARLLWQDSEHVEPDPKAPLKYSRSKDGPQASHLLAFIREALGRLGYSRFDPESGRANMVPTTYVEAERKLYAPLGGASRLSNISDAGYPQLWERYCPVYVHVCLQDSTRLEV